MKQNSLENSEDAGFLYKLTRQLFRWDCVESGALSDYALGSSNQRAEIEQHLQTCVRCRQELQLLEPYLVQAIQPPQTAPTMPFLGVSQRQTALGLRGEDDLHKVLFRNVLNDFTIELFIGVHEQQNGYLLNGQFMLSAETEPFLESAQVELWQDGQHIGTVEIDDLGAFTLNLHTMRPLFIRISGADGLILFSRIEL